MHSLQSIGFSEMHETILHDGNETYGDQINRHQIKNEKNLHKHKSTFGSMPSPH